MNQNKTTATNTNINSFLDTLDAGQKRDSQTLIHIMQGITGEKPVLWGTAIVGFGSYHYKSKSGREGDWMIIGFAPRKGKLSLYITYDAQRYKNILDQIGKHEIGKGCIYFKNLDNVDIAKLTQLVEMAYKDGTTVQAQA